jgi:uncharacterized membrane protein YhaH (DUF805 family)
VVDSALPVKNLMLVNIKLRDLEIVLVGQSTGRSFLMEPKNMMGWTVFDGARSGRMDIVQGLIEELGEDPNAVDVAGHRAMDYAIAHRQLEVRGYLESVGGLPYKAVVTGYAAPQVVPDSNKAKMAKFAQRLVTFEGWIDRMTFIGYVVSGWIAAIGLAIIVGSGVGFMEGFTDPFGDPNISTTSDTVWVILMYPVFLVGMWVQFAAAAKRSHDLEQSSWLQVIPVVNIVVYLILVFRPSKFNDVGGSLESDQGFVWGSKSASDFEKNLALVLILIVSGVYDVYSMTGDASGTY